MEKNANQGPARRLLACAAVAALALSASHGAIAGPLRIDFGDAFNDFGADWTGADDDAINVTGGSLFSGTLPFATVGSAGPTFTTTPFQDGLHIGSVFYKSFCVSGNGSLWFAESGDACTRDPTTDSNLAVLNVLGADPDYQSLFPNDATSPQAVSVSLGLLDRDLDGDGVFDRAAADPALRILWNFVTDSALNEFRFQAVFFDLGGGDFDLEYNYAESYATGIQSFTAPGITPFTGEPRFTGADGEPVFTAQGGAVTLGGTKPPTTVPEPNALWLVLTGGLVLLVPRLKFTRETLRSLQPARWP